LDIRQLAPGSVLSIIGDKASLPGLMWNVIFLYNI
jgi:hypothetical protein